MPDDSRGSSGSTSASGSGVGRSGVSSISRTGGTLGDFGASASASDSAGSALAFGHTGAARRDISRGSSVATDADELSGNETDTGSGRWNLRARPDTDYAVLHRGTPGRTPGRKQARTPGRRAAAQSPTRSASGATATATEERLIPGSAVVTVRVPSRPSSAHSQEDTSVPPLRHDEPLFSPVLAGHVSAGSTSVMLARALNGARAGFDPNDPGPAQRADSPFSTENPFQQQEQQQQEQQQQPEAAPAAEDTPSKQTFTSFFASFTSPFRASLARRSGATAQPALTPRAHKRRVGKSWLGRVTIASRDVEVEYSSGEDSTPDRGANDSNNEDDEGDEYLGGAYQPFPEIFAEEPLIEDSNPLLQFIDWLSDQWIVQKMIPVVSFIGSAIGVFFWGISKLATKAFYFMCGKPLMFVCWLAWEVLASILSLAESILRSWRNVWLVTAMACIGIYLASMRPNAEKITRPDVVPAPSSPDATASPAHPNLSGLFESIRGTFSGSGEQDEHAQGGPAGTKKSKDGDAPTTRSLESRFSRLESRIGKVERSLVTVSAGLRDLGAAMRIEHDSLQASTAKGFSEAKRGREELTQQLQAVGARIDALAGDLAKSREAHSTQLANHVEQLRSNAEALEQFKKQVTALEKLAVKSKADVAASSDASRRISAKIIELTDVVDGLRQRLQEHSYREEIVKQVLDAIRSSADLPGFLVARRSEVTGEIELPPELWEALDQRFSKIAPGAKPSSPASSAKPGKQPQQSPDSIPAGSMLALERRLKDYATAIAKDAARGMVNKTEVDSLIRDVMSATSVGDKQLRELINTQVEQVRGELQAQVERLETQMSAAQGQGAASSRPPAQVEQMQRDLQALSSAVHEARERLQQIADVQRKLGEESQRTAIAIASASAAVEQQHLALQQFRDQQQLAQRQALNEMAQRHESDIEEVQKQLDEHMQQQQQQQQQLQQQQEQILKNAKAQAQGPDWAVFLDKNRQALSAIAAAEINAQIESRVVLSQEQTLELIETRLRDALVASETAVKMLGQRVDALSQHDAERASERIGASGSSMTKDQVEGIVQNVVASALRQYRADVLAIPDYALENAGAQIVEGLTSPTYTRDFQPPSLRAIAWVLGARKYSAKPPSMAISQDMGVGQCWGMAGSQGTLGITLALPIIPTDMTIEHVPKEIMSGGRHVSAPRFVELWAVLDTQRFGRMDLDDPAARAEVEPEQQGEPAAGQQGGAISSQQQTPPQRRRRGPPPAGLLLGQFEFNPVQESLKVFPLHRILQTKVQTVVLRIRSNWGNSEWTCLYRVRIHGRE
nr:hypothetical protein HK105_004545 [Polyrhizophydium stewartii]